MHAAIGCPVASDITGYLLHVLISELLLITAAIVLLLILRTLQLLLPQLQTMQMCRTLADAMGGSISFKNNEPKGTIMSFVLPATLHQPQLQRSKSDDSTMHSTTGADSGYATHTASSSGTAFVSTNSVLAENSLAQHEIMAVTRVLIAEDNRINQKVSTTTTSVYTSAYCRLHCTLCYT
jgi:hypothetical protein